jgi:hypothetical protein
MLLNCLRPQVANFKTQTPLFPDIIWRPAEGHLADENVSLR